MEPAAPGPCAQPEGPIVPSPCSSPPPAGSVAGALYLDDRHSFLFTHSPTTVPPSSRGSLTLGPILTGPHTHTHTHKNHLHLSRNCSQRAGFLRASPVCLDRSESFSLAEAIPQVCGSSPPFLFPSPPFPPLLSCL